MRAVVVAAVVLAGAGCTSSRTYLAKVNHETITGNELRQEFARHHYALEKLLVDDADVAKYVNRLVDRRLFVQEAYRIGLQDAPDVREAVAKVRGQKMIEAYLQDEVESRTAVAEEEVRAAHARLDTRLEVRQVVVKTREEAEAAAAAIAGGKDMEALARERSIAESANRGGMIVVSWGGDEAYEALLFTLPEGGTTAPFKSAAGWEVARVEKRNTVELPAFDKVAQQIRQVLKKRKRHAREEEVYSALWAKYDAKVLDCAPDVASLRAALASKDPTPCASWRGGTVAVAAFAERVKVDQLDALGAKWPDLRKVLVEDLVNREVVKLEAEERGYGNRPEIVEKVTSVQDDLVESKLYREYVVKDVKVGEDDAKRYHAAHPEEFVDEAELELAQILVDSPEVAKEVEAKVRSRQPFAELAATYSKDKRNAAEGGRIGFVKKGMLTDAFAPVAALGEGEVSAPIRASDGWHLIKVLSVKPERPQPYDEVAALAQKRALEARQKEEVERWVATLRKAATIEISQRGIKAYGNEVREQARRAEEEKKRAKESAAASSAQAAPAPEAAATPAAPPAADAAAPAPGAGPAPSASTPAAPATAGRP